MTAVPTSGDEAPVRRAKSNRLLAALRTSDLDLIASQLRQVSLARGQVLFEPGDDVHTTYFPSRHTMICLMIVTQAGDEIEVATVGCEGAIGGVVSAGHKPAFGRAVVQAPGSAYAIATQRLDDAKGRSPRLADLFSRYSDALLAQVMQSVACNALHNLEQRCCRWLLASHDRSGDNSFRLTQETLARMLGVQRTSVNAAARALQAAGLIDYDRGRVEVLDRAGLERAACECYAAVEGHFTTLLPEVDLPKAPE